MCYWKALQGRVKHMPSALSRGKVSKLFASSRRQSSKAFLPTGQIVTSTYQKTSTGTFYNVRKLTLQLSLSQLNELINRLKNPSTKCQTLIAANTTNLLDFFARSQISLTIALVAGTVQLTSGDQAVYLLSTISPELTQSHFLSWLEENLLSPKPIGASRKIKLKS